MSRAEPPHGANPRRWVVSGPTAETDAEASSRGLRATRDLFQMRRPLPLRADERSLVAETVPFLPGTRDEADVIEVNNAAFRHHPDQGNFDEARLHALMAEPWFDPEGVRLGRRLDGAPDDAGVRAGVGDLTGFCWTRIHPADPVSGDPALGEIFVIGIHPRWQGTGLGRGMTLAGLSWLAEKGLADGMLYVDATNTPAVHLYVSLGFTTHHVDRLYEADEPTPPTALPIR